MLRITVHDSCGALTFQLEGRLAGAGLRELQECWRRTLALHCELIPSIDLTGVTFIDEAGKACLSAMYRRGAEFVAADCMTKAILAEITQPSIPANGEFTTT